MWRLAYKRAMSAKNAQKPTNGCVWIAKVFPPWQSCVMDTMRGLYDKNNNQLPDNRVISAEVLKIESLKKYQKKVMPFVAGIRDRVEELGKVAMDVTVDFDENEIISLNVDYLKNTLDLESLEICFTDDPKADQKTRDEVRPGIPHIAYSTKPSVNVTLDNPVPRSGFFTQSLNISDGDTVKGLKEKLAKLLNLKEINAIQLWSFEDPVLGPRKIPVFNDYKSGKVQIEEGTLSIDLKANNVFVTFADNKKIEIGTSLVYIVA